MKDKRPYYIFGTAAILLLAFFIFFGSKNKKYNWTETYREKTKDPYGTYIIHELLKNYNPDGRFEDIRESVRRELPTSTNEPASYVFIGEGLYLDTSDVNRLLAFVDNGNTAFISSKSIPYDLMYYIYPETCDDNFYWEDYDIVDDTTVTMELVHPQFETSQSLDIAYLDRNRVRRYEWAYIDSVFFCEEPFSPAELGYFDGEYINFCSFKHGKGTVYLHTTPLAFTNIRLLEKEGKDYAAQVLSHLEKGPIYWDNYSRIDEEVSRRRNQSSSGSGGSRLSTEGPLKYVLSQPPLAWAWYLTLALTLFYLLFRTKRRQRVIPVLEPNANTSMEFISTIGSLYFLRNDHKKLSRQKMKLFLAYIRERYHLPTNQLNDEFVNRLVAHSEVPKSVIEQILLYYKNIKNAASVTEKTLIDFHIEMDKFYKNCK
ncbi:MAG: DUF4350 domain-containing protein [Bacteroidota bacterium]